MCYNVLYLFLNPWGIMSHNAYSSLMFDGKVAVEALIHSRYTCKTFVQIYAYRDDKRFYPHRVLCCNYIRRVAFHGHLIGYRCFVQNKYSPGSLNLRQRYRVNISHNVFGMGNSCCLSFLIFCKYTTLFFKSKSDIFIFLTVRNRFPVPQKVT